MLIAENLTYAIKQHTLLHGISFSISPGEFLAILGANGAGKSTLLKLLSGEYRATMGQVYLGGKPLASYADRHLATLRATMAQQHHLSADFPVREVVFMGRYPHYDGRPTQGDHDAVDQAMHACGITSLADRSVLSLSGGEQQRVHLARVLAQLWDTPHGLLLLDEPVSAMDVKYQHQTLAIAKALAAKGWMVISILHDMNLASQYANRLMLMKHGRKLHDGTAAEVLSNRNVFTVFGIDAHVGTDPTTLKTVVVPAVVTLNADTFGPLEPERN